MMIQSISLGQYTFWDLESLPRYMQNGVVVSWWSGLCSHSTNLLLDGIKHTAHQIWGVGSQELPARGIKRSSGGDLSQVLCRADGDAGRYAAPGLCCCAGRAAPLAPAPKC